MKYRIEIVVDPVSGGMPLESYVSSVVGQAMFRRPFDGCVLTFEIESDEPPADVDPSQLRQGAAAVPVLAVRVTALP